MTDYTATKAALAGYTRGAARDLGPRGITVNIVQAGLVDTEMNPADTEFAAAAATTTALGPLRPAGGDRRRRRLPGAPRLDIRHRHRPRHRRRGGYSA